MRFITIISLGLLSLNTSHGQIPAIVDTAVSVEISNVMALSYNEAINLLGKKGQDTATYITTTKPSRGTYCVFFRAKSGAFNQIKSSSETDQMIETILNGEPYTVSTDSKYLFLATDQRFKSVHEIDKEGALIEQKRYIVVLTNERPKKLIKASKKR